MLMRRIRRTTIEGGFARRVGPYPAAVERWHASRWMILFFDGWDANDHERVVE
jgi:hypothetical protein